MRSLLRRWAASAVLTVAVMVVLSSIGALVSSRRENRTITELAGGYNRQVGTGDSPGLLFARAKFYLDRDDFEAAQPLLERVVQRGSPQVGAAMLYDAGNARLHHAIKLIEDNKFDQAAADVVLARDFLTRSLRIDPGFWDAKYNLDIAMRLVRDFPDVQIPQDDTKRPTTKLWTDLPGLPKGGP